MYNYKKSIGMKFNHLTITDEWKWQSKTQRLVKCICDCGNETWVLFSNITKGHIKSCGCMYRKALGDSEKPETKRFYNIWRKMNSRCYNENDVFYYRYGQRNISIIWKTYEEFKNDMFESYKEHVKVYGEKNTSIDRINVNGNYCKENCRWATTEEQSLNKENTRYIVMNDGSLKTIKEVATMYNIKYKTLDTRYCKSKHSKTRRVPIDDVIKDEDIV